MKTLSHLALVAFMLTSVGAFATETPKQHQHGKANSQQSAHTHACPMDPEITGNKGDSCPKCGMDLEPKAAAANKSHEAHKGHQHH
ncbi:MAG: heavy metal-binding domain-containing protein [Shewanella sp.]|uniref:heavy metal-binding domain-containing protein n=1 Tax=Shewanella sp. TaxID=50422 RepID=UPI003F3F2248